MNSSNLTNLKTPKRKTSEPPPHKNCSPRHPKYFGQKHGGNRCVETNCYIPYAVATDTV